jgi:hypothetical protein
LRGRDTAKAINCHSPEVVNQAENVELWTDENAARQTDDTSGKSVENSSNRALIEENLSRNGRDMQQGHGYLGSRTIQARNLEDAYICQCLCFHALTGSLNWLFTIIILLP